MFDDRCSLAHDMAWAVISSFLERHYDDMHDTITIMFNEADVNKDGMLDIDELGQALASIGIILNPVQLRLVRNDIDINGDGLISFEELMKAMKEHVTKSKFNQLFDEEGEISEDSENSMIKNKNKSTNSMKENQKKKSNVPNDFEKTIIKCRKTKEIVDNDAILLVAWRKIIDFLKLSTANAQSVEQLFQSITKVDEKNMNLTLNELVSGLKLIGVILNEKEIIAINKDLKTKVDNFISLIEFAVFVEEYSLKIANEEKEAWTLVLASLVPGGGGAFIGGSSIQSEENQSEKLLNGDHDKLSSVLNDPIKRVELLFNTADIDSSGYLDIKELYFAMKSLGIVLDEIQLGMFYETLDQNKDGKISLEEFVKVKYIYILCVDIYICCSFNIHCFKNPFFLIYNSNTKKKIFVISAKKLYPN